MSHIFVSFSFPFFFVVAHFFLLHLTKIKTGFLHVFFFSIFFSISIEGFFGFFFFCVSRARRNRFVGERSTSFFIVFFSLFFRRYGLC